MPPMNSPFSEENTADETWQQANEARLRENAQRWIDSRQTTLFSEKWEGYFVAVTREGQRLVLWMLDAEAANTDWIQSVMDLHEPLRLQSSYTQAMLLSLLWQPAPRSAFLSGLGGGCLAVALHHHLTRTSFVCVEIAAPVATAATRFFGFQPDHRMSLNLGDAKEFLQQDDANYDLMLLDIFCDQGVSPSHVMQAEFFALCRMRMLDNGLLAVNAGNNDPEFNGVAAALADLFATVYACRGRGSTTVFFATDQPPRSPSSLRGGTTDLEQRRDLRFPLQPWTSRLTQLHPPPQQRNVDQASTPHSDNSDTSPQ